MPSRLVAIPPPLAVVVDYRNSALKIKRTQTLKHENPSLFKSFIQDALFKRKTSTASREQAQFQISKFIMSLIRANKGHNIGYRDETIFFIKGFWVEDNR